VTLLAVLALPILATLGLGRRARMTGVLTLIAIYVPLTGAGPSILRAGAMGFAGIVAALAGRPASRWYALLLAAAFTLVLDPRAWLDPGWQLSFAAVVGILVLAPGLTRALGRLPETLAAGVAVTVSATVATAPLIALHFGRVSIVSLAANLVALPVVAPIMWLGMLAAAVSQVSVGLAAILNGLNAYCLGYLAMVARLSASLPHAVWSVRLGSPTVLAGAYASIGGLALTAMRLPRALRSSSTRARALCALATAIAVAVAGAWDLFSREPEAPGSFTVTFLDVGQGDATLIQAPGGVSVLVDGGPPDAGVARKLHAAGVRSLDLAVLTHAQEDHQGGLESVLRELPVEALLDGGYGAGDPTHHRIVTLARGHGTRVLAPRAGQVLRIGGLRLTVLNPGGPGARNGGDPNDRAVVLTASYHGFDLFLPADAESNVTLDLPLRPVELLKVAHHGSEDEGLPALLQRLSPEVAVVEVGAGNRYGHPRPKTLAALRAVVPGVLRTDQSGDVRISLGARGPLVETGH
jgi:competence protein ComEC